VHFKYPGDAISKTKKQKNKVGNIGHFMHSTVASTDSDVE